jgi:hypothetical protein
MGQTRSNGIIGARSVATGPAAAQPRASAALTAAGRALLLGLACAAAAYALARSAQASATGHGPDALVAGGVLAIGALAAAWLALGCAALLLRALLAPVCRLPAALDRVVTRATPRLLRRVVTAGVGAGIAAGSLGLPAIAVEAPPPLGWQVTDGHPGMAAPAAVLPAATSAQEAVTTATTPQPATATGLPNPQLTTTTADATTTTTAPDATPAIASPPAAPAPADAAAGPAAPAAADAPRATVVVRAGDCLWSIAAAHLPADASDADIAAAWPAWYAANAATIGPDPDRLVPGQVLAVPPAGAR